MKTEKNKEKSDVIFEKVEQEKMMMDQMAKKIGARALELVDLIPVGHGKISISTLESALTRFDLGDENTTSYIVRVRKDRNPEETLTEINKDPTEDMYLRNGKLNAPFLLENARILLQAQDPSAARKIFQALLKTGEKMAEAYLGIAESLDAESQHGEAQKYYEESIAYQPTLETFKKLSINLSKQKKYQQVAETLKRATELEGVQEKAKFDLYRTAANYWLKTGLGETAEKEAIRCFDLARKINPASEVIPMQLGSMYLEKKDYNVAKKYFEDVIMMNPQNARALAGLGAVQFELENLKEAYSNFVRSLNLDINNPTALYFMIKCAYRTKSYQAAAIITEAYIDRAPVNADLLYCLAGLQFHLGEAKKVKTTLKRLFQISPNHSGGMDILKKLES